MAHSLVKNFFLIVLIASLLLSILNSLFTLVDMNGWLSLFGFYGVQRNHKLALLGYILFCSIFSTIIDVARLLLWFQYLQDHTLGYVTSLGNYYIILLVFGMLLKVIGGIFAWFLWRGLSRTSESERSLISSELRVEHENVLSSTFPMKITSLNKSDVDPTTQNISSSIVSVSSKSNPLSTNIATSSSTRSNSRPLTTSYTSLLKNSEI